MTCFANAYETTNACIEQAEQLSVISNTDSAVCVITVCLNKQMFLLCIRSGGLVMYCLKWVHLLEYYYYMLEVG